MTVEQLYESLEGIDNKILEQSEMDSRKSHYIWKRWIALAAALCLVFLGSMKLIDFISYDIWNDSEHFDKLFSHHYSEYSLREAEIYVPEDAYRCYYNDIADELVNRSVIPNFSFLESTWDSTLKVIFDPDNHPYYFYATWYEGDNYYDSRLTILASYIGYLGYSNVDFTSGTKTTLHTNLEEIEITALEYSDELTSQKTAFFMKDEVYYCISGLNLTYQEMVNAIQSLAINGINLDALDPAEGVQPKEWYTNPSYEECLADKSFGQYVPSHIPDSMTFDHAERNYSVLTTKNGWKIDDLTLIYSNNLDASYNITISWADTYGEYWAGPMLEAANLSVDSISQYVLTENADGTARKNSRSIFGVWYDNVMVCIWAEELDAQTIYDILTSIQPDKSF